MVNYIYGVHRPSKKEFEENDRYLSKMTTMVDEKKFSFETLVFSVLPQVLHSANTIRNYHNPLLTEKALTSNMGDSMYMLQLVTFKTNQF
jgi:hypothetical protein